MAWSSLVMIWEMRMMRVERSRDTTMNTEMNEGGKD
jgi:hypothetical protein